MRSRTAELECDDLLPAGEAVTNDAVPLEVALLEATQPLRDRRALRRVQSTLAALRGWLDEGERRLDPPDSVQQQLLSLMRAGEHAICAELFALVSDVSELLESQASVTQQRDELHRAASMQRSMTRRGHTLATPHVSVACYWRPTSELSGDWWSAQQLGTDRIVIAVGDAVGHGPGAAMCASYARATFDLLVRRADRATVSSAEILGELNTAVRTGCSDEPVMTCTVCVLDVGTGRLELASAGHPPPYLLADDGPAPLGRVSNNGPLLGAEPDPDYVASRTRLAPGALMLFYTDGLLDCGSPARGYLHQGRFTRLLRAASVTTPESVRDFIRWVVYWYCDGGPPPDDVCAVSMAWKPRG